MSDKIEIIYKGTKITFDTRQEEWVAKLNTDFASGDDTFKRHTSLQKLKDAIDRFNKKEFKPIPILLFTGYHSSVEMKSAEIISFTEVPGECWIRHSDGRREKINTVKRGFSSVTKIYACENIVNEPIVTEIMGVISEVDAIEKLLEQKRKQAIHLIDSLQVFDIGGYVSEPESED